MLQAVSIDTKKATARGNSRSPAGPGGLVAPPVPILGNQATLRLMRKCDCGGAPDCDCDMGNDKKQKEKDSPRTALHRKPSGSGTLPTSTVLDPGTQSFFETRLQRKKLRQAVPPVPGRLVQGGVVGDAHEPRADAVADPSIGGAEGGQVLARKEAAGTAAGPMTPEQAATLAFSGSGTDVPYAQELGARMSHDFSSAHAYFGSSAAQACEALGAEAFTVGNKIAFRRTGPSRHLVAHELTHVVQQGAGLTHKPQTMLEMSTPSDPLERQADDFADRVTAGETTQVSPDGGTQLARDGGVTAGLILGGIAIIQSQINAASGGLTYSSDQITYPSTLASPMPTNKTSINQKAAYFYSAGLVSDNESTFNLHGEFSDSEDKAPSANRFMANVYIDLAETSEYSKSELGFTAKALQSVYGTAEDPRIRFVCSGRFDPAGPGDCRYRFVLEVRQNGVARVVEASITAGSAKATGPLETPFYWLIV